MEYLKMFLELRGEASLNMMGLDQLMSSISTHQHKGDTAVLFHLHAPSFET